MKVSYSLRTHWRHRDGHSEHEKLKGTWVNLRTLQARFPGLSPLTIFERDKAVGSLSNTVFSVLFREPAQYPRQLDRVAGLQWESGGSYAALSRIPSRAVGPCCPFILSTKVPASDFRDPKGGGSLTGIISLSQP